MINPNPKPDRRVQRTYKLLIESAREVMREKGFDATTIQDITDGANVNRATFYAHFVDKYDLVDALIRERIQKILISDLPHDCIWGKETLFLLTQTILELYGECHKEGIVSKLREQATYDEIRKFIIQLLEQQIKKDAHLSVPIETIAHVVCWVIFGAADQWSKMKKQISSKQMAEDVLLILMEGVEGLIPED